MGEPVGRRGPARRGRMLLTRRALLTASLAAGATAGLSGCQGDRWYPSEMSQDERVLRAAITGKERLITRYREALEAGEGPAELLETMLGHHEDHLEQLRGRLPEEAASSPPQGAPDASPSASPEPVPSEPPQVGDLQTAEEAAAVGRTRECAQVLEPALAQLLASVGACEIGHAHLLAEEAR